MSSTKDGRYHDENRAPHTGSRSRPCRGPRGRRFGCRRCRATRHHRARNAPLDAGGGEARPRRLRRPGGEDGRAGVPEDRCGRGASRGSTRADADAVRDRGPDRRVRGREVPDDAEALRRPRRQGLGVTGGRRSGRDLDREDGHRRPRRRRSRRRTTRRWIGCTGACWQDRSGTCWRSSAISPATRRRAGRQGRPAPARAPGPGTAGKGAGRLAQGQGRQGGTGACDGTGKVARDGSGGRAGAGSGARYGAPA